MGEMSYFLELLTIRAAKFCTAWILLRLCSEVLPQKLQQWYSLLKTTALIPIVKVVESKACLTRLIWPRRAIQLDTVEAMWSLYVKQGSRITPKYLATAAGLIFFPNKVRLTSSTWLAIALLPKIIEIVTVLVGLKRSWFLKADPVTTGPTYSA